MGRGGRRGGNEGGRGGGGGEGGKGGGGRGVGGSVRFIYATIWRNRKAIRKVVEKFESLKDDEVAEDEDEDDDGIE